MIYREILYTLVAEFDNPDIANAAVLARAVIDAKKVFREESDAIQKPSAEAKVSRVGRPRKDGSKGAQGVGRGNGKRKTSRKARLADPGTKAAQAEGVET